MNSTPDGVLRLRLHGQATLERAGARVSFPTRHSFLLLAYLALHAGSEISRASLAEIVWPNAPVKAGRDRLRSALVSVRRALPFAALLEVGDSICLRPGFVHIDTGDVGDFMPGFDQDWVIEQRLEFRSRTVQKLLAAAAEAWEQSGTEVALDLARQACQVDPWSEEAAECLVRFLEDSGHRDNASVTADSFRNRMVRDLGIVTDVRPQVKQNESHPLITAAEWLLDREPEQLIDMLAATQEEWLLLPVDAALEVHERALRSSNIDTPERRIVWAQHVILLSLAGRLPAMLLQSDDFIRRSAIIQEPLVSSKVAGAFAYGYLSLGDFKQAKLFASQALAHATQTRKSAVIAENELLVSIILTHIGEPEQGWDMQLSSLDRAKELPRRTRASHNLVRLQPLLNQGKVESALEILEEARKAFFEHGTSRVAPWIHFGESQVYDAIGDNRRAFEALEKIKTIGQRIGGHAVMAAAEDELAKVSCRLGEFTIAAEAHTRAAISRRSLGTVPSIMERKVINKTKQILKARLSPADLRSAIVRAASSANKEVGATS